MQETFKVTCPCCDSVLVIRRRDGLILETREPIIDDSTGDRFEDAFKKVKQRGEVIDSKVSEAKRIEAERKKNAEKFFKDALKRAQETPTEKPFNPLDMD